jgi:alpha-D-xyloside xylohydrolase
MLRLLAFDFRDDPAVYNIDDQFMFGPALLVNPVTEPMYFTKGSQEIKDNDRSRKVYLPDKTQWYDFWTGRKYKGGHTIKAETPIERLPLFIRAGSIIPMGPIRQFSGEAPEAAIKLHVYPGCNGSFQLYEDEGDGYNYEKGAFSTINIHWIDSQKKLILDDRVGSYQGMSLKRSFEVVLHNQTDSVKQKTISKTVDYEGKALSIDFK